MNAEQLFSKYEFASYLKELKYKKYTLQSQD